MKITGKVVYQNINGGFWGVVADDGQQYEPVNFPEQLKYEGRKVKIRATHVDTFSISMWGTPIRITAFHTL